MNENQQRNYENWRSKLSSTYPDWGDISKLSSGNFDDPIHIYPKVEVVKYPGTETLLSSNFKQDQRGYSALSETMKNSLRYIDGFDFSSEEFSSPETIQISGITPRGKNLSTPRCDSFIKSIAAGSNHVCALHRSGHIYSWGVNISNRLGLPDQIDHSNPSFIQSLQHLKMKAVSCGYSHSGSISEDGNIYMWGSTNSGKTGIGSFIDEGGKSFTGCYLPNPTKISLPQNCKNVVKMSCGYAHTALITEIGQLFVFGCGDGGRLGLGKLDTVYSPTLVDGLSREKIADVSCGNCSTIVCTQISVLDDINSIQSSSGDTSYFNANGSRIDGGKVYVAGSSFVLGKDYKSFTLLDNVHNSPIVQVSAGYRHSCLVSISGELLSWGNNVGGCCGFSKSETFIQEPRVVKAMHYQPENLAYKARCYQSSTFRERHATYAVDGKKDGSGLLSCSCTMEESHAWLEVDLGFEAIIDEILVWNRSDSPNVELGGLPRDFFTCRLFPMWIMIASQEFDKGITLPSYQKNLALATAKKKFEENRRVSKWLCTGVQGRFVRIQLEDYNFLNVAEIEVFGKPRLSPGVGRVGAVSAGRDCTVAIIRPTTNALDIAKAYKRAVYSDARSAEILRQLPTYVGLYDKFGKDVCNQKCPICTKKTICEVCRMYNEYEADLEGKCNKTDGLDVIANTLLRDIDITIIEPNKQPSQERRQVGRKKFQGILEAITSYLR